MNAIQHGMPGEWAKVRGAVLSLWPLFLCFVALGAFGAALAFTLFFSLYPHEAVDATFSEEVQAFDWLFHALCYATLSATWLLGRAKRPQGLLPRLDAALAFASLGCALELAQALLPFVARTCTLSDASANAFGALLGALLVPLPPDPR